ncbi:hypothetical protein HK405_008404, partial [Cladochytrium tenue]
MSAAPARVPASGGGGGGNTGGGGGGGGLQRSAFAGSFARLSDAVANNEARPACATAAGGPSQQQLAAVPAGAVVRLGRAFAAFCAVVEAGVTDGVARVGAAADAAFAAGSGGAGSAGGGVGAQRLARMASLGSFGDLARAPGATIAGIGGRRRGPSAGVVRGGGRGLGGGPAAATGPSAGDNGGSGGGVGASAAELSSSSAHAPLRRSRSVLRVPLLRHDSYGGGLADGNGSNNNSGGGGGQSVPSSSSGGDGGVSSGGLQRVRSVRRLSSGRVRAVGGGAAAVFLAREGFRVKFTVEARLSAGQFGCGKLRAETADAEEDEDDDDDDDEAAAAEAAEGEVVEQAREVVEAVVGMVQAAGPLVPGTPVMVTVNAIVGVELIISDGVPCATADPASPTATTVRRPFTWRMQAATPDMRARIALRQAELEAAFKRAAAVS